MSEQDSELKDLLPGDDYKLLTGATLIVKPVPFGKQRLFSTAISRLMQRLQEQGLKLETIKDWNEVFDIAFEEVVDIMVLVLGKPRDWFDTITMADGYGLLALIVEQNFSDDTKKNIQKLITRVTGLLQTPSSSS